MAMKLPVEKTLAEKLSTIDKICDKVNKKAGFKVMGRIGRDKEMLDAMTLRYIPTPCRDLNIAIAGTPDGGWPRGRCTLAVGKPDSGKTSVLLETIGKQMAADPNFVAAWLESEHSLTKEYACGTFHIDPQRFVFIPLNPDYGAEKTMDMIQGVLGTGSIDMFVINSLACLVPTQELEADLEASTVAVQARFNSRLRKKFLAIVGRTDTAFIAVGNLTTAIGSMSRDPLVIGGGLAMQFWSSLTLDFRKHSVGAGEPFAKTEAVKIGVTIKKNHCRQDIDGYQKVEYYAVFGKGIDQIVTMIPTAIEAGILEQHGAWLWWKYPSAEDGYIKFNGKGDYRTYMEAHPDKMQELVSMLNADNNNVEMVTEEEAAAIEADEKAIKSSIVVADDGAEETISKAPKKKAKKSA